MSRQNLIQKLFLLAAIKHICIFIYYCSAEKVKYLSVERPNVTYINPKYVGYLNQSSRRFSRKDPVYYHELHFEALVPMNNSLHLDFYFYEWLTNQYKPTFVEMHFKWCDLIHKDKFFGAAMKQGELNKPCPHKAGAYHLYNMTVPGAAIPDSFPFKRGRINCNLTMDLGTKPKRLDWVAFLHIDMEIKTYNKKP